MGVTTGNTLDIVRAIEENRLDMGLVTLPVSGRALDVMPVMDEEFVFIASRSSRTLSGVNPGGAPCPAADRL